MKPPIPGSVWQHYKGGSYIVLAVAKHSETQKDMVVYKSTYNSKGFLIDPQDQQTWVRPLSMWFDKIPALRKSIVRFKEV